MIVVLLIIIVLGVLYFKIRSDIVGVWRSFFGNRSVKEVIDSQNFEFEETPKSLYGMETTYKSIIKKDFPDLNLNELKAMTEGYIISYLGHLEKKDKSSLKYASDKMNEFIISKIDDLGNDTVNYDSIKIHKTILNRYEKKKGIATMKFQTGLEYMYKKNNGKYKKIQDRFTTEFIYIIDESQVSDSVRLLGLNCPNCGAPIKSLGEQHCDYCGTGVKNLVKRSWILNNISQF